MVLLLIDFVSHPKFLFHFEAKEAKLGVSFAISLQKVSLCFASVLLQSEIRGHPSRGARIRRDRA